MTPSVAVLDTVTLLCPLGVRFRDAATGSVVTEGLVVEAYPAAGFPRRTTAIMNRSGVFAFHGLPGMRDAEQGAGDEPFWASPPAQREFIVEVGDLLRRFQPCRFRADVPARGLFALPCLPLESPPRDLASVPLYSAPARAVPAGMAAVRAEFRDTITAGPAAWALLEIETGGRRYQGFADGQGRVALYFPYPEPEGFRLNSPIPGDAPAYPYDWPVEIRVFYRPYVVAPQIPDLCSLLDQPEAAVWGDSALSAPPVGVRLQFGRDLILQTSDAGGTPLSQLFITPATSPVEAD